MRNVLALSALSLLVACGPSKESYALDSVAIACDKLLECGGEEGLAILGYDSVEACKTELQAQVQDELDAEAESGDDSCPNYDSSKASACLDEYAAMSCDAETTPTSCDEVCPE